MFNEGSYWFAMHGFWLWWPLLLVVAGLAIFYGRGRRDRGSDRPLETPEELLRRRLAGGEITPQEYEERRATLDRDKGRGG